MSQWIANVTSPIHDARIKEEEAMCKEAMVNCPADAIGDFGEDG